MSKAGSTSTPHLPGLGPMPPLVEALRVVVKDRYSPAARGDRKSGPLGFHDCVNLAMGLEYGWPAVAYWEHEEILRCHHQLGTALTASVGPVQAWAADPDRTAADVCKALGTVEDQLIGLTVPSSLNRRGYLPKSPGNRRYLPDVAVAAVALWWSRRPKLSLAEVLTQLRIEPDDTVWQVLGAVDRRIRRTPLSNSYTTISTDLLINTRAAIDQGVSVSPGLLLWHVANRPEMSR